jgi:hypothetical protein
MLPARLTLGGRDFERVCLRQTGVAVYSGDGTYLRIGPGLEAELDVHQRMLRHGFPVAAIVEHGLRRELPYYVEQSLGPSTLGDLFLAEREERGGVSDQSFDVFRDVMARLATAQAGMGPAAWSPEVFGELVGLTGALNLLPDIAGDLRLAFESATARLARLPGALLHRDLHPDNACAGGIIDLEGAGWGVRGYDVMTAVFVPTMCDVGLGREPDPPRVWFTSAQLRGYLQRMDRILAAGAERPSDHLDALLLCRAISLCAHRHRDPDLWRARRRVLREALESYQRGDDLAARWGLRVR